MPLSRFIDTLVGARGVRQLGEQAERAAQRRFDPAQLNPQAQAFQRLATEGIGESADIARRGMLQQMFAGQPDPTMFGGNQARALAGAQQQQAGRQRAIADFERGLSEADIQARQQGQMGFAQTRTQQRGLEAQRDAAIQEAQMQTESEIQRRRGALGATALGVAGTALTTPFGEDGTSLLQRGLQSLFGGEEDGELGDEDERGFTAGDVVRNIGRRAVTGDMFDTDAALDQAEAGIDMFEGLSPQELQPLQNIFGDMGATPQTPDIDIPDVDIGGLFDDRLQAPEVLTQEEIQQQIELPRHLGTTRTLGERYFRQLSNLRQLQERGVDSTVAQRELDRLQNQFFGAIERIGRPEERELVLQYFGLTDEDL